MDLGEEASVSICSFLMASIQSWCILDIGRMHTEWSIFGLYPLATNHGNGQSSVYSAVPRFLFPLLFIRIRTAAFSRPWVVHGLCRALSSILSFVKQPSQHPDTIILSFKEHHHRNTWLQPVAIAEACVHHGVASVLQEHGCTQRSLQSAHRQVRQSGCTAVSSSTFTCHV